VLSAPRERAAWRDVPDLSLVSFAANVRDKDGGCLTLYVKHCLYF